MGTSIKPPRWILPAKAKTLEPLHFSVPKAAKAASDDLTASQARQVEVQRAVAGVDAEAAEAAEAQAAAQNAQSYIG